MSWAQAEFHDLELGDARRTQCLIKWVDDRSGTGFKPLNLPLHPMVWRVLLER